MHDKEYSRDGELISFRTKRLKLLVTKRTYTIGGEVRYTDGFTFSKMVNGKRERFPLSEIPKDAETLAEQIAAFLMIRTNTLEMAKKNYNPRTLNRPSTFSTIGEVFTFHTGSWKVLEVAEKTGKSYQQGFLTVTRYADSFRKGTPIVNWSGRGKATLLPLMQPWLDTHLSPTVINGRVADDYQKMMLEDTEDDEDELRAKITANSTYRGAKFLFSTEALKLYKKSDLVLPYDAIEDFQSVSLFSGAQKFFVLPDMRVIQDIFQTAPRLKKEDVNAYRAFLLCVQAGLRKAEAANMRMNWLREQDTPVIVIESKNGFKPKHGHGRVVRLEAWVAKEIRELAGDREFFLDGNEGERTERVFDRLIKWQRERGVDATKPIHELRKFWFSQKVKRFNELTAAQEGGHKDLKVTQQCYADSKMPSDVLPFWELPTLAALQMVGLKIAA